MNFDDILSCDVIKCDPLFQMCQVHDEEDRHGRGQGLGPRDEGRRLGGHRWMGRR